MNLYPALKATMGDWTYYIVKMRMREVAQEVQFGSQVHQDVTLDEAIQRELTESRVKSGIIPFLTRRPDRFFSSIVVAAVGGSPKFHPVRITDDERFELFKDAAIDQSFGVLTFVGDQKYYALDGQHRLKAIKSLLIPDVDGSIIAEPPEGFADEEISVLMVIRPANAAEDTWLRSYRRLFSSLNRYARATDRDTNIIMDEDDCVAIVTRRLISEHAFFKSPGRHRESYRIQTKGRPLRENERYFTSLQQLYDLNKTLLMSSWRSNTGWGEENEADKTRKLEDFIKFRPSEQYLDALYDELVLYWDALIETVKPLSLPPAEAKNHQSDGSDGKTADNVLFWPIGQDILARLARVLLDDRQTDPEHPKKADAKKALSVLGQMEWRLHQSPWRGLLLTWDMVRERWAMRSEDRNLAVNIGFRVARWMTRIDDLAEDELETLKFEWQGRLAVPEKDDKEQLWLQVQGLRDHLMT